MPIIEGFVNVDGKRSNGYTACKYFTCLAKTMNMNITHSTVTFLRLSISMCPGSLAYKMDVTGSGAGF